MFKKVIATSCGVLMLLTTTTACSDSNLNVAKASSQTYMEYTSAIFEKAILKIEITTTEEDWEYLMENATDKPWITGNVTIDGEAYDNVGVKTKGNTSLKQVASSDSDRYSLKIDFDKYIDGQSCYGLDRLVLNNIYADTTYMKEYISYKLFNYMEVPSSLCTFAEIYVNGEQYGVFLALEDTETSFITRNYGYTNSVKTYKPESMDMDQENDRLENNEDENKTQDKNQIPNDNNEDNENQNPDDMNGNGNSGGMNGGGMGGNMPDMNITNMIIITDKDGNTVEWTDVISSSTSTNFDVENLESFTDSDGNITTISDIDMRSLMSLDLTKIISAKDTSGNTLDLSNYALSMQGFGGQGGNQAQGGMGGMPSGGNGGGMGGNGGMSSGGVSLVYTDDSIESYSNIFDEAITDVDSSDQARLISSLKAISEGENLEDYIDVDEVLRYTACNVFLVNLDSYFSSMGHNYVLAENNGVLSMVPWDYNLAFGTFQGSNASDTINFAIDTVFSGVDAEDRPIIGKLLENEEYVETYHKYLKQIAEEFVQSGMMNQLIDDANQSIKTYVENDSTSFYTYSQYTTGVETLKLYGELRAESILGQLDGTIPSTTSEQTNSDTLIDASALNLSSLGSMGGNMQGGNMQGGNAQRPDDFNNNTDDNTDTNIPDNFNDNSDENTDTNISDNSNDNSDDNTDTDSNTNINKKPQGNMGMPDDSNQTNGTPPTPPDFNQQGGTNNDTDAA
ncbi:MAG: hypothetical protein GX896_10455 [Clostridiales bacterium]|nr:hypothetical protein [Clostridiales bacterium]